MFKPAHDISFNINNSRFFFTCSDGTCSVGRGPISWFYDEVVVFDSAYGDFIGASKQYVLQNLIINNV